MGRIGKKVLSWTLCLAMAVGMLPGMMGKMKAEGENNEITLSIADGSISVKNNTVKQGSGGEYTAYNRLVISGDNSGASDKTLSIEAAKGEKVTVVFYNVTIKNGAPAVLIKGNGEVTIQLEGDNTVKGAENFAGIQKSGNGELTITSSKNGILKATGGMYGAGIGGGYEGYGTDITIGGSAIVTAEGGYNGAGIGSGYEGICSNIVICDKAQVTAEGGDGGAGIGGGYRGTCSNITIKDKAQVTATGGSCGAGIGGGFKGYGATITISDKAQVTAEGGDGGAGIGGGYEGPGAYITIGDEAIVTAIGGHFGAGIGGGEYGMGTDYGSLSGTGHDITISGDAQVTATGGYSGAGIGGGYKGEGNNIKVYDRAIVSVSGGKSNNAHGAGAGVGNGGKSDSGGNETVITFTDDNHKIFKGNVLYYEKGSSAEKIKNGEANRINFVTVTLKANDGTDAEDIQVVSQGVPLPTNSFTREGHYFTGWNTQADGKGTPYADQSQQIWKSDPTLYVQWGHIYNQTIADETKYRKSAATCTEAAVYYKSCECGAYDPDGSDTFEYGNPLGHEYKNVAGTAKAPTCTEAGKEADQECSGCHDVITGAEIAKLAHTFNQEVATDKYLKTPADCTHKAVYFKSCVCGETGTETFESEALGHDYKDVAGTAKAATCKEAGKEADKKCERCGDVITGTVIAKTTDHKWKAATGYDPKTCEICGATEGDVIKYDSETGKIVEHTQGDQKDETVTYHRSEDDANTINHYKGVQIDGKDVTVDAKSGSVIITFDADTLNALSVGDHVITVIFDDWKDEMKLVIKAPVAADTTPTTGDTSMPVLWAMLILISMVGTAVLNEKKRREA